MGTYRAALKAPDRLVVRMATRVGGAGGYQHYLKYQKRREPMPCAIVLGCPPYVAFMGPQKLPIGVDEITVAGGLAGGPINIVRARTIDLMIPAESEFVIEGLVDTEYLEPEGPFGESHGHVALEEFNMPMRVTAITHRKNPIIPSYISQVAPSESSVIKRVAYEPLFTSHLRNTLGIRGVKKVALHEPLTGLLRVTVVTLEKGTSRTEVWRALQGAAFFKGDCGKICIAVNEDIDVDNADALLWAMAYRMNPVKDVQIVPHRGQGHGPKREHDQEEDFDPTDGRNHERRHAAAGLAEKGIHGTCQGDMAATRPRHAAVAATMVRLFARRLAAAMGRGGHERGAGPLSRQWPDQREAAPKRAQARDQVSAGQGIQRQSRKRQGLALCHTDGRQTGTRERGRPNVRFGSLADIRISRHDVRS